MSGDGDDETVRITLRLPKSLHTRLTELARKQSLNAEIVMRLESSFWLDEENEAEVLALRLERVARQVDEFQKFIIERDIERKRMRNEQDSPGSK